MSEIIELKCTGCGGEIVENITGEFGTCVYCGKKYRLIEKQIIEHTGTVIVDGIATVSAKLTAAYQSFLQNNVEKANKLYKEVCEIDPENPNAFWGRFLCELNFAEYYGYKDKYGNSSSIIKANIILDLLKYADLAIQYADDELKEYYQNFTQPYRDFVEEVRKQMAENQSKNNNLQREPSSKTGIIISILVILGIIVYFLVR